MHVNKNKSLDHHEPPLLLEPSLQPPLDESDPDHPDESDPDHPDELDPDHEEEPLEAPDHESRDEPDWNNDV